MRSTQNGRHPGLPVVYHWPVKGITLTGIFLLRIARTFVAGMFCCGILSATTVAIVRDGNSITVGADSLGTYIVGGKRVSIPPICKIVESPRLVFTATGRVLTTDGFDAYGIAKSIISSPGDFDVVWIRLRKKMDIEVRAMNARDQADGTGVKKGEVIMDIELFGVAVPPRAVAWKWVLTRPGTVVGSTVSINDHTMTPLGRNEAIKKWLGQRPFPNGAVNLVTTVLDVEADGESEYVGRPFSILAITPMGIKWIKRGACH